MEFPLSTHAYKGVEMENYSTMWKKRELGSTGKGCDDL